MSRKPVDIVTSAMEKYGSGREAIMQMLTDVNRELGHVPEEAIRAIAAAVGSR